MSGFASIDNNGRRSPAQETVNILVRDHLNTEEKRKKAIAVNKLEIERLKSGMRDLRTVVQEMAEDFDQRLNILERLVLPPPGRASPSGGKRRRKRKRTRKKKRRN
jgi:hypothetical protein